MKILIIGADGFIGQNVAKGLEKNFYLIRSSWQEGLDLKIDLTKDSIGEIARKISSVSPDILINCAGIVPQSGLKLTNQMMTEKLLKALKRSNQKFSRIFLFSSAAIYNTKLKKANEDSQLEGGSNYARDKIEEEKIALKFAERGLPIVILRLFNPLGEGMQAGFIIPRILSAKNEEINLESERDFFDVREIPIIIAIMTQATPKRVVYNVGSGKKTKVSKIVDLINRERDLYIKKIEKIDEVPMADISRLKKEFNWKPTYNIKKTIERVLENEKD